MSEKFTVIGFEFPLVEPHGGADNARIDGDIVEIRSGDEIRKIGDPIEEKEHGLVLDIWQEVEASGGRRGFILELTIDNLTEDTIHLKDFDVFKPEIEKEKFADACFRQAVTFKTNPAYLYALAFCESGTAWTADKVTSPKEKDGAAGTFQFVSEVWASLIKEPGLGDITSDDIKFPQMQCVAAAAQTVNSAKLIKAFIGARGITSVDLYLAHLFGASGDFGSKGAKIILKAKDANENDPIKAALDKIYTGNKSERESFIKRKTNLLPNGDATTIKQFLDVCAETLDKAYDAVEELGHRIAGSLPKKPDVLPGPFDGTVIEIKDSQLDALGRISHAEANIINDPNAITAVAETILNRVAHRNDKLFGDTIESVINQPGEFEPIINTTGKKWEELNKASAKNQTIVADYIAARSKGEEGKLKGATHFLNPIVVRQRRGRIPKWAVPIEKDPIAKFGTGNNVHFHGFAKGEIAPEDYAIKFGSDIAYFRGDGTKFPLASQPGSIMAAEIVRICRAESVRFEHGKKKETDSPQFKYVGEYWRSIGRSLDGRNDVPWSAAFISFVIRKAGGGNGFKYAAAHSIYVQAFVRGMPNAVYIAARPENVAPRPGDIVHYGREGASRFDFDKARAHFSANDSYSSHSDIVVAVDKSKGVIETIGGNVGHSVKVKKPKIDSNGRLLGRPSSRGALPWIAVLKLKG